MVKKCHMKSSCIKQTLSRSEATEEQRVHNNGLEMVTTKKDGDEDSFESTQVSASKATQSRNEVQKVTEKTPSQNRQLQERARSHKQHEVGNQKRRERRTNSPESLR